MDEKHLWEELIERKKNFHGNFEVCEQQAAGNEDFCMALYDLKIDIIADLDKKSELNGEQILATVYHKIFNFVIRQHFESIIFIKDSPLHDNVYKACLFTTLCMFLHDTKRIKGMSLQEFLYKHSPQMYSNKGSKYYFNIRKIKVPHGYDKIKSMGNNYIKNEETTLRQTRHRLLKSRPVYVKKPEWSAISKDSEHEWTLYYGLDIKDNDIQDTFKRIGNLYNGIYKEIHSPIDNCYQDRLAAAYKKFYSKLKKIKYENFLKMQKAIFEHICENNRYYGMNIYRFEKELRLFSITNDVNLLLNCNSEVERDIFLENSVVMNGIYFPKVYKDFSTLSPLSLISNPARCSTIFLTFMDHIVGSGRLVIDELVEKGYWGEDWENLFLKMINEMVEDVFYDPNQIDYSVTPKSQELFIEVITAPVYAEVSRLINRSHYMQISSLESNDEL